MAALHRGGTTSLDEDPAESKVRGRGAERTARQHSSCRGRREASATALTIGGLRDRLHSLVMWWRLKQRKHRVGRVQVARRWL
jgi:hypothetical protein